MPKTYYEEKKESCPTGDTTLGSVDYPSFIIDQLQAEIMVTTIKIINPDTNKKNITVRDYPGYQSVLYLSSLEVRRGMALTNPLLAR